MDALLGAFGIDWRLLVIQAINFGLLLFVLWYFLYKPVLKILNDRRQMVAQGIADAQAAGEELRNAESEKEKIVSQAVIESDGIVNKAKKHAADEEAKIIREANEKGLALVTAAEKKAEEEKARIMREAEKEIAQMVVLGMEKTLRTK